ncbi:hypothetical protein Golomagni_02341 [Golovinomyces magnicellulatus]|nr:hypothetical protein Golomagni_02341 [Golovinomyces magnicellulatus]
MGNNSTKEARGPDLPPNHGNHEFSDTSCQPNSPGYRNNPHVHSQSGRGNRPDLFLLGAGSNTNISVPERRETKQEREARKLEKEKHARIKERERSMKEESVDGGFLVTMGVYTGTEDFNKAVVRQLIIERKIAPFWRGLNEYSESWTENQLIAAGRGLPIPAADEIPQKDLSQSALDGTSHHSVQNPLDPISSNSDLIAPDAIAKHSAPEKLCSNTTSNSILNTFPSNQSSALRSRSKTFVSLTNTSQSLDSSDIVPQEIKLPYDPYVNGQPIEAILYKDAIDCPICFLSYPPYLNKTRCCDQPMCSECFVQIKRPYPHPPEQHYQSSSPEPQDPTAEAELLVCEPACCPYCQQPEFGVIYEPPSFRRGLAYVNLSPANTSSDNTSLLFSDVTNKSHPPQASVTLHERRMTSISANASTVITTDRIRPDWATKLANARSQLARRSAAATALHTAAYLMGNGNTDTRSFNFRSSRLGRSLGVDGGNASGSTTQAHAGGNENKNLPSDLVSQSRKESQRNDAVTRRNRIQEIEELMMMEAIRLSLATEEERKKKIEKENSKETKKKAKEDKKRERKEKKGTYEGVENPASGSALSLGLPGLGRRRGNSITGAQVREANFDKSEATKTKGKEVDRRTASLSDNSPPIEFSPNDSKSSSHCNSQKARATDNDHLTAVDENNGGSMEYQDKEPRGRQRSGTSSLASSFEASITDSPQHSFNKYGASPNLDSLYSSRTNVVASSVGNQSVSEGNGGTESESLLNFQSLTAIILDEDDPKIEKDSSSFRVESVHHSRDNLVPSVENKGSKHMDTENKDLYNPTGADLKSDGVMIMQRENIENSISRSPGDFDKEKARNAIT